MASNDSINLKYYQALERDINQVFADLFERIEAILLSGDVNASVGAFDKERLANQINSEIGVALDQYTQLTGEAIKNNVLATKEATVASLNKELSQYVMWASFSKKLEQKFDFMADKLEKSWLCRKSMIDNVMVGERIKLIKEGSTAIVRGLTFDAVENGGSAWDLAKKIENYLAPKGERFISPYSILKRGTGKEVTFIPGKKIPVGSVRYNALRIARTEMAEINRITVVQSTINEPYVKGHKWNLSRAHPKEDVCDDLANHDEGLGKGVYKEGTILAKHSHPNCLCFITVALAKIDELRALLDPETRELARQFVEENDIDMELFNFADSN